MKNNEGEVLQKGWKWLLAEIEECRFGTISLGVVMHHGRIVRLLRTTADQPFRDKSDDTAKTDR